MNPPPPSVMSTCFFKIIGNSSSEARKLEIPHAFWMKTKQALRSGPMYLRNQFEGPMWPVKLVEDQEQGVYLRDGWTLFFKNNNLVEGDILLFTHLQGPHMLVEVCLGNEPTPRSATPVQPERNEDTLRSSARRSKRKEYYPNEKRFATPATSKKSKEIPKPSGRSMRREYPEEGRSGIPRKGTTKEPTERGYVDHYSYKYQYEMEEEMFDIPRKGGITSKKPTEGPRKGGITIQEPTEGPRKGGITIKEPTDGHYMDSDSDSDSDEYANRYVDDYPDDYMNRHADCVSFKYQTQTHYEIGESSKRQEEKGKAKIYEDARKKYNKRR